MKTLIDPSPIFAPHANIALQFSGGKDSLAIAYLLQPYWNQLTFYHVDTGDLLPEVREIVADMAMRVPRFARIETNSRESLPSDLVPTTCTPMGLAFGASNRRIIDRFECCATNIMAPMHRRMLADAVTLVIRGTKRADMPKLPASGGDTGLGYTLWLPIIDWSHEAVFAYLREVGAPICRVYDHKVQAPECATCPAWWNEGRAVYLRKHHPALYEAYQTRLRIVAAEVLPVFATLEAEMQR